MYDIRESSYINVFPTVREARPGTLSDGAITKRRKEMIDHRHYRRSAGDRRWF